MCSWITLKDWVILDGMVIKLLEVLVSYLGWWWVGGGGKKQRSLSLFGTYACLYPHVGVYTNVQIYACTAMLCIIQVGIKVVKRITAKKIRKRTIFR